MEKRLLILWLLAAMLLGCITGLRAESHEGIIISGPGANQAVHDLTVYNRIEFETDRLLLLSSTDSNVQPIELFYEEYNRVTFGQVEESAIEDLKTNESRLTYDRFSCTLAMVGDEPNTFSIAVYSVSGMMILNGYGTLDVSTLSSGAYIGIASDGMKLYKLKFIK